jgi:large subunit ribosomal protein L4
MKLKVYSPDALSSRDEDVPNLPVFEGDRGLQALKEVIVAIRANQRQGTRSTKTRGEVSGGGKKPWRQKGTGRARAGSIRSPLWVGGGVVFGPRPRDFSKKINQKVSSLAFSRALFDRASAGRIEPKGKLLLVDAPFTSESARAARNLARVSLQEAAKLNALDLAQYRKIIVSSAALKAILVRVNGAQN